MNVNDGSVSASPTPNVRKWPISYVVIDRVARVRELPTTLILGLVIYGAAILGAIAARLALHNPTTQDLESAYAPIGSGGHLLGADPLGRDVLTWIASSVGTSLSLSISVVLISATIGVTIGLIAGYFGGLIESVLMRVVDLQLAVPPLLLFLSAEAVIAPSIPSLVLLLSLVGWVPYARIVRTKVQVERERASIVAARLAGSSWVSILYRHLLPATAPMVLVLGSLQLGYVLLWEAGLSFLGFGVQPPDTSLGFMISQGRSALQDAWWIVVFPGLALTLLVLASNLTGDGLRDALGADVEVIGRA